jgi:uncharacterized protein
MNKEEVKKLAKEGLFKGKALKGKVIETHISWVILAEKYAFKIKKPIQLSFLDFSTLSLRRTYCQREVELNGRFTDIYRKVLPVYYTGERWLITEEGEGRPEEYVVWMKRMASGKKMDYLLEKKRVSKPQIQSLAKEVAHFHQREQPMYPPFDLKALKKTFNDISPIQEVVEKHSSPDLLGEFQQTIPECVEWSDRFLDKHGKRLRERVKEGNVRDVHGDLHSGNIFLYEPPILFDCIEFHDAFRQIDILYEVAFMCMDLEAFGEKGLSDLFLATYQEHNKTLSKKEDKSLFIYFKCLRANIRAKVQGIALKQARAEKDKVKQLHKYLQLMEGYMEELKS